MAFNIFQVYQYLTIYRWYFALKFEHFRVYLIQYPLKSGGTKYHFEGVKVHGTAPFWKACTNKIVTSHIYCIWTVKGSLSLIGSNDKFLYIKEPTVAFLLVGVLLC